MHDSVNDLYGLETPIREVAGGHVGWNSGGYDEGAAVSALEEQAAVARESWANVIATNEPRLQRIEQGLQADARDRDRRYREMIFGRQANGPEVGRALGESLVGGPVPVRESVHPLGKVISGAHSHGSVRHTHDRLPGDHLHCMHCGGDSRLCLDNPHHAEGPIPVRESNGQAEPNVFVEAMDAIYDGETSPVTPGQALAHVWRLEQAGRPRSAQSGKDDGAAWERWVFGGRP